MSSYYASHSREIVRKALRAVYAWAFLHRVTIICGGFNGAAYTSSTGTATGPSTEEYFHAVQSPLAVEEMHFLIGVISLE